MELNECWYKDVCIKECTPSCVRFNVMKSLCEKSLLSKKLWFPKNLIAEDCDLEAYTQLNNFKNNILEHIAAGDNLLIYSRNCGNGKTQWASKIMMRFFDSIWHMAGFECKALFIHTPGFMIDCKEHFKKDNLEFDDLLNKLKSVSLVVWDDVTLLRMTDYEKELFLGVLDARYNKGLSNIFTSNLTVDDMQKLMDRRLFSRICSNSIAVEFVGHDKRGLK